jgi:hypothetical protein
MVQPFGFRTAILRIQAEPHMNGKRRKKAPAKTKAWDVPLRIYSLEEFLVRALFSDDTCSIRSMLRKI